MRLFKIASAIVATGLVSGLVSACGTQNQVVGSELAAMAPPGVSGGNEYSLSVIFAGENNWTPSPGMYWGFGGEGFHVEVSRDATKGIVWKNNVETARLNCVGDSYNFSCEGTVTDGSRMKFRAITAADHPRIFPYATLTVESGSTTLPPQNPPVYERHLMTHETPAVWNAMYSAAYQLRLEGRYFSCAQIIASTLQLLMSNGMIYPAANASDINIVNYYAASLRYPYGLCY